MNPKLASASGFTLGDLAEHPPFAESLLELVAGEENGQDPPYGPALVIGAGSRVWGVKLGERGSQVSGGHGREGAPSRARTGGRGRSGGAAGAT